MTDYGHELAFGTFLTPQSQRPGDVVALAQLTERAGLDLVSFQDHPYQPAFLDAWTLLSWVAAQTRTLKVAPNVLTRKWNLSWARGSHPAEPGERWWPGSGGLGACCTAGFGDAAEGDFEAEGAEFADVVGDLPADVLPALVIVRTEVLVARAGAG